MFRPAPDKQRHTKHYSNNLSHRKERRLGAGLEWRRRARVMASRCAQNCVTVKRAGPSIQRDRFFTSPSRRNTSSPPIGRRHHSSKNFDKLYEPRVDVSYCLLPASRSADQPISGGWRQAPVAASSRPQASEAGGLIQSNWTRGLARGPRVQESAGQIIQMFRRRRSNASAAARTMFTPD